MGTRRGSTTPTLRVALPYKKTYAPIACDLMEAIGQPADDAERGVLSDWLAYGDDGSWTHRLNYLECSRQNLKTWSLITRMLFGALVRGERILYTAQNGDTASEIRETMYGLVGESANDPKCAYPWLNKRVLKCSKKTGHECIYFRNGGRIYFSTRTNTAKLGYTVDVVLFDECQELTEAQLSALMATASAAPLRNPQYIFVGTPPTPETKGDGIFQAKRDAVANGTIGEPASLNEWSVSDIDGFVLDAEHIANPDYWYACNPALGVRITEDAVRSEVASFVSPLKFAQQRLGYWLPPVRFEAALDEEQWMACATTEPPTTGLVVYAVKFSADGSTGAIAACRKPESGKPHIEVIKSVSLSAGIDYFTNWLAQRKSSAAQIVVDGASNAQDLTERLLRAKVPQSCIVRPSASDVIAACSMLNNAVKEQSVTHFDQPALNLSATHTKRRPIGKTGGWGFASTDEADATLIEACALAHWQAITTKRDPSRKAVVF